MCLVSFAIFISYSVIFLLIFTYNHDMARKDEGKRQKGR